MAGGKAEQLEKQLAKMGAKETKELLLLTMYKLSVTRSQLDAVTSLLVKKKVLKADEIWAETGKRFSEE